MILGDFKSCMATRYGAGVVRHCEHGVFRLLCCGPAAENQRGGDVERLFGTVFEEDDDVRCRCMAGTAGAAGAGLG